MKKRIEQMKRVQKLLYEFKSKYRKHPVIGEIINIFRLMDIELNNAIPTARISLRENRLHVEVSPIFFNHYLKTSDDIGFVICHEILHYVLGHLTIEGREAVKRGGQMQANLAMDIVINHKLYKIFKEPGKLFVKEFYKDSKCPVEMLMPTSQIEKTNLKCKECKNFYRMLALKAIIANSEPNFEVVLNHVKWHNPPQYLRIGEFMIDEEGIPPNVLKKLRELLERFGIRTHGSGGELRPERIEKIQYNTGEKLLSKIREMLTEDEKSAINIPFHGSGVLPFYGRSDILFLSQDTFIPLFHANPAVEEGEMGVRIYVDVSVSIMKELPFVLALIDNLRDIISFPVYCLSTIVKPVSYEEILNRKIFTTGGTDYNAFARHLVEHGYKKAIFITDGYSYIDPYLAFLLRQKSRVLTILTTDMDDVVKRFSRNVFLMEGSNMSIFI